MAITDLALQTPSFVWAILVLAVVVVHFARIHYEPALYRLPGPFLASLTDFWRLFKVSGGHYHQTLIDLHRYYTSDVVRIGPNAVSVADPEAVNTIYGLKKGFVKVGQPACESLEFNACKEQELTNANSQTSIESSRMSAKESR